MIDHFGINCADLEAAKTFYDTVLEPLGFTRQMDFGEAVGYGRDGRPEFWISRFDDMGANREVHVAFTAPDAEHVRAFHQAASGLGAETLHAPRLFPEYHEHYYGAFVRDPDGNNVEAVCHTAGPDD
ncbi:MAG TPA: VOC family protein [Marmoricola sp.]